MNPKFQNICDNYLRPLLVVTIVTALTQQGESYQTGAKIRPYNRQGAINYRTKIPPPRIENRGDNIRVTVGDDVELPCRIRYGKDYSVVWRKDEAVIRAGPVNIRKDLRISVVDKTSLLIKGVDTVYSGNYTCEIEWSGEKKPISVTHYLEVLVPPSISLVGTESDGTVRVEEGSNVTLRCKAEGVPKPQLEWTSNNWQKFRNERVKALKLYEVQREAAGSYFCRAFNRVGKDARGEIKLIIEYSPVVQAKPELVKSWPGENATLTCLVKSMPSPNVEWYFHGQRLKPSRKTAIMEEKGANHTLVISELDETDLGIYTCKANNRIGEAETRVELTGLPQNAVMTSHKQGKFSKVYNLTWAVNSFGRILDYDVKLKKACHGDFKWQSMQVNVKASKVSTSSSSIISSSSSIFPSYKGEDYARGFRSHIPQRGNFLIENLTPNCKYLVKIKSRNRFGWSDTSIFKFKTSKDDPNSNQISGYPGTNTGALFNNVSGAARFSLQIGLWSEFLVCFYFRGWYNGFYSR